ncbi:MAG: hypothetical protein LUD02_09075 [Tannerellaceae bacterium]|nr:hypothetical protein [Tannerellaceae bacterium]
MAISLIVSCQADYNYHPQLRLAEEVMNQYPDSALRILEKMDARVHDLSSGDQAFYYLLLTQAHDKNYITHTTDSLINISIDYFEKQKTPYYLALSYYYKGRVYADLEDNVQVQDFYLKALEYKDQISDYTLLGLIHSHLGTLYSYSRNYMNAKEMYLQALNYYTLNNDSTRISYVLRNVGRVFVLETQADSAYHYYEKALQYANSESAPTILPELGNLYLRNNELDKSLETIRKAFEFNREERQLYPLYAIYGELLIKLGQLDSAQFN